MSKPKKRVLFHTEASYLNTGYSNYGVEVISRLIDTGKYEVAELSNYGTADDARRSTIKWKNYPVAPKDSDSEEIKKHYHSNAMNQFGAWRFERACLDFKPDIFCFPKGAIVLTDDGYRPIESLVIGDMVLTHKNRFRSITKTFSHKYNDNLIKIYGNGICEPMEVTPNHPVLIYRKKNQTNQKKSVKKIYEDEEAIFVEAQDLTIGDYLVLPTYHTSCDVVLDIADYAEDVIVENDIIRGSHPNNKFIKRYIDVDKDFATLCGYIMSDGYISDASLSLFFAAHEQDFVQDAERLFYQIFGLTPTIRHESHKAMTTITCSSTLMCTFLKKLTSFGTKTGVIPKELFTGSDEVRSGFIRGMFRGDGCYTKNTIRLTTVNRNMAYSCRAMLASLGICATIYKHKYKNHWSDKYELNCYGQDARKIHKIVEKLDEVDTPSNVVRSSNQTTLLERQGHIVCRINKLSTREYDGFVFNIEVEEDNSYVSQFCTHNCGQMDSWMEAWVRISPYRNIISWAWASTVDGAPQNSEWINQFASTDYFYTLSDWGTKIIKEQGGDSINHIAAVSACAPSIFVPCPNKFAHRISMGINPEWNIIGTVMRNQRRKLFPDLFEAFGKYLEKTGDKNTYLYCHTSYPDNGWDIPNLLVRNKISSRVLFTYACNHCNNITVDRFADTLIQCKKCKQFASKMSNVSVGATTEQLGRTYQVFDLYFQCANSEGIGMPQIEAAACGIPIMSVDYSAMSDVVRKLNGYPVPLSGMTLELETGCYRAIPDKDAIVSYWESFFSKSKEEQYLIGMDARKAYESIYNWDKVVDSWMISLDDCPTADWERPIRQISLPQEDKIPEFKSNKDFLDWAINTYLPYSNLINSYEYNNILRDLNFQSVRRNSCGYFYSEVSYFDRVNYTPFHKTDVITMMRNRAEAFNFWEKARLGYIKFKHEDWL